DAAVVGHSVAGGLSALGRLRGRVFLLVLRPVGDVALHVDDPEPVSHGKPPAPAECSCVRGRAGYSTAIRRVLTVVRSHHSIPASPGAGPRARQPRLVKETP